MDCSSQPRRRRDLVVRNCAAGSATRQRCADAGDMAAEAVARAWAVAVGQQAVRRLGGHSGSVAMLVRAAVSGLAVDWRRHGGPCDI